jgi:hypothetical protein
MLQQSKYAFLPRVCSCQTFWLPSRAFHPVPIVVFFGGAAHIPHPLFSFLSTSPPFAMSLPSMLEAMNDALLGMVNLDLLLLLYISDP